MLLPAGAIALSVSVGFMQPDSFGAQIHHSLVADGQGAPPVDAAELPDNLAAVCSPLNLQEWGKWLAIFPDARLAELLLRGFRCGFRISFNHSRVRLADRGGRNMASAREHPEVVSQYLRTELQEGRIVGPVASFRSGINRENGGSSWTFPPQTLPA